MIRDRITTNTITAERQEKSPNGVAGISWPVYAILQPLFTKTSASLSEVKTII